MSHSYEVEKQALGQTEHNVCGALPWRGAAWSMLVARTRGRCLAQSSACATGLARVLSEPRMDLDENLIGADMLQPLRQGDPLCALQRQTFSNGKRRAISARDFWAHAYHNPHNRF